MLDLREFGTRERVLGDVADPLIPPEEADQQVVDNLNIILSSASQKQRAHELDKNIAAMSSPTSKSKAAKVDPDTAYDLLDSNQLKKIIDQNQEAGVSLVDLKKIRLKGKFHEKHLSSCPVMPKFHAAYGEPSEVEPSHVD